MAKEKNKQSRFVVGQLMTDSFETMEPREIIDNLEASSYSIQEEVGYTKKLDEDQLNEKKTRLSEVHIEMNLLEDEKKEYVSNIKAQVDPLKSESKELLEAIKRKAEFVKGNIYEIDDQEEGTMYQFDEEGRCIGLRPLLRKERQLSLVTSSKASNE